MISLKRTISRLNHRKLLCVQCHSTLIKPYAYTYRPDSLEAKPRNIMNESSMSLFFVHGDIGNARLLHESCNIAKHTGKQTETLHENGEMLQLWTKRNQFSRNGQII